MLTKLEHVLCLQNGFIYLKTQQIGKTKHVKTIIEICIYITLPFILECSNIPSLSTQDSTFVTYGKVEGSIEREVNIEQEVRRRDK